jgi:MFS family permease
MRPPPPGRADECVTSVDGALARPRLVGASIEWFDFYLYGVAAALVFPTLYFPEDMPAYVSVLASLSTYAVGFVARPFGAVVFGYVGDRLGRKAALTVALVVMGLATALIGLLPGYAVIGVAAPTLLVLLRCVQGLAIGGQWGAMLLVVESAPPEQRGFYGSFAQVGAPAGVVLANLAFIIIDHVTDHASFIAWGWRLPFLLSAGLVGLAWYIHTASKRRRNSKPSSSRSLPDSRSRRSATRCSTIRSACCSRRAHSWPCRCRFILPSSLWWSGQQSRLRTGMPKSTLLTAVMCSSGVMAPSLLSCGRLSDRFGRRRVYLWGAALTAVVLMFPLIETREPFLIFVAVATSTIINGLMYGPQAALFGELFPTSVRYSGASTGLPDRRRFWWWLRAVDRDVASRSHARHGLDLRDMAGASLLTIGSILRSALAANERRQALRRPAGRRSGLGVFAHRLRAHEAALAGGEDNEALRLGCRIITRGERGGREFASVSQGPTHRMEGTTDLGDRRGGEAATGKPTALRPTNRSRSAVIV